MFETKINFTNIRQKIEAASNLQDAGETKTCNDVLRNMCEKLLESIPKENKGEIK